MTCKTELLDIKNKKTQTDATKLAKKIFKELKISIRQGYDGKTFGFYITPAAGAILNDNGLKYKTYTDGEFEESSVWIEELK